MGMHLNKNHPLYRSGMKEGDITCSKPKDIRLYSRYKEDHISYYQECYEKHINRNNNE